MSHTLSDWRVEGVSDAVRIVTGTGKKKVILARLCPPQIPEDETWANARLMGQAPKLAGAVDALLRLHAEKCRCAEPGATLCPAVAEARKLLEEARKR